MGQIFAIIFFAIVAYGIYDAAKRTKFSFSDLFSVWGAIAIIFLVVLAIALIRRFLLG